MLTRGLALDGVVRVGSYFADSSRLAPKNTHPAWGGCFLCFNLAGVPASIAGCCCKVGAVGERLGHPGLIRRVPEGVQIAADQAMETTGVAGIRLAQAWEALSTYHSRQRRHRSTSLKPREAAM